MYVRLCKGLNDKGQLLPEETDFLSKVENKNIPHFTSVFKYNEDQYNQFIENGTVKGITDVKTDKLWWDIDNEEDLDKAQADTIELVNRLIEFGIDEDDIFIAFSGKKGFDVTLITDYEFDPSEVRNICKSIAKGIKIDTTLYNSNRIFRLTGTKHADTGLFKTALSYDTLRSKSIETIKELAKEPKPIPPRVQVKLPEYIVTLAEDEKVEEPQVEVSAGEVDMSRKPRWMPPCKYALQQGFYEAGEGNQARIILGATYKAQGFDRDSVASLVYNAERKRQKRTGRAPTPIDDIYKEVVSPIFNPLWRGGQYACSTNEFMQSICEKKCLNCEAEETNDIMLISDVRKRFENFAKNIDKNRITTGLKELDDNLMLTTGMCVGVLGSPGAGKTSLVSNFIEHLSITDNHIYFDSLDMYDSLLYARYLQKYCNMDFKDIVEHVKNDTCPPELEAAKEKVMQNFGNVGFSFKVGVDVEDIERRLMRYEKDRGVKVKLHVIDYLEKIKGPYSDDMANVGYVISALSDLAKKHDTCIIILLQPQKSAGTAKDSLLSMRQVKGNSKIEQDLRVILTMWRPGFNARDNSDDKYASVAIVKNNMGPTGQFDFYWDGITGRLTDLDNSGKRELERLLERLEQEQLEEIENSRSSFGGFSV